MYADRCSLHLVVCSSPRQEVTSLPIGASSGDERVTCASRASTRPGLSARVSLRLRQLRQHSRGTQVTSMRTHLDLTVRSRPCSVNPPPHTHTHTFPLCCPCTAPQPPFKEKQFNALLGENAQVSCVDFPQWGNEMCGHRNV